MKPSERLKITDVIGRELQSRYSYNEIDEYLAAFGISPAQDVQVNSKWVYTKAALKNVSPSKLAEIVDDLGLASARQAVAAHSPPSMWKNGDKFRLFISHISKNKDKAIRLRETLSPYGIVAFVAHEDILPTREWMSEIEQALFCMDAFLAIHTIGFSSSNWTQQEVGFAVARGVKIISLKMGEDPTGFISKHQALARRNRTAEEISKEIFGILLDDSRTSEKMKKFSPNSSDELGDKIPF